MVMYNDAIDGCVAPDTPRPSGTRPPETFMLSVFSNVVSIHERVSIRPNNQIEKK